MNQRAPRAPLVISTSGDNMNLETLTGITSGVPRQLIEDALACYFKQDVVISDDGVIHLLKSQVTIPGSAIPRNLVENIRRSIQLYSDSTITSELNGIAMETFKQINKKGLRLYVAEKKRKALILSHHHFRAVTFISPTSKHCDPAAGTEKYFYIESACMLNGRLFLVANQRCKRLPQVMLLSRIPTVDRQDFKIRCIKRVPGSISHLQSNKRIPWAAIKAVTEKLQERLVVTHAL